MGDRSLARERERFLSQDDRPSPEVVRDDILGSWQRCSSWSVPADRVEPPYRSELNPETALLRAATPVLNAVRERLGELGVGFLLTDADGLILDRRVCEPMLIRALDASSAAPGFVFAEDAVGTNGIGTAIELGRTTRIDGFEHYTEQLVEFTCVGVPIVCPVTRRPLGILDVSCAADRENDLIALIAEQTGRLIEERLFDQVSAKERALLRHFMSASRRSHGGIVVLNERFMMSSPRAARFLNSADQPLIWERAEAAITGSRTGEDDVPLAGDSSVRMRTTAIYDGGDVIGAMLEIRRGPTPSHGSRRARSTGRAARPSGLAGSNPAFLDACGRARAEVDAARPLVITGEHGVGKLAVARDLLWEFETTVVLDATEAEDAEGWLDRLRSTVAGVPGPLILRRLELLGTSELLTTSSLVRSAVRRGWRCVVTATSGSDVHGPLLPGTDAVTVRLPPLRDRIDDVRVLVAAFTEGADPMPEVVQLLTRLSWPGNVAELRSVVRRLCDAARDAAVRPTVAHLPPEVARAATRRTLTRFERAEIHAILDALAETGGNKRAAAGLLGISRSTLYRKLQPAGIDLDNTVF